MKNSLLIALLLHVFNAFPQAKGEAWFYAMDHTNKVVYLTELQEVVVEDKYNHANAWRQGFVELMGWQKRTPDTYLVSFNWMSKHHAKWYESEKQSRDFKIESFKKRGYNLKWISMPQPKNEENRPSKVSAQ
ncbi:hypothetical protein [Pedobacter chitinilyticus]|uniref:DUF3291 domain-containing protein n=1 Tax=Pedobacter chitinilyticus TaxID=2233776 RepID=A0A3S4RNT4_9SPHI|nr:hypothetical protein [Pedobacter chitinilyticus]RWU05034.1 hypothetical protein DPV69_17890 [Pedobacter chitinilyticus]